MAAEADGVLILDVTQSGEPGEIDCARLHREPDGSQSSHWLSPVQVLVLCRRLYSVTPRALVVSVGRLSIGIRGEKGVKSENG
jgi:Ni,Fe-hydrogenase maturation factor